MVPPDLLIYYQTINEKTVSEHTSPKQIEIRSSAFRTDRKDMSFEKKSIEKYFLKKYNRKNETLIFRKSSI